MRRHPWRATIGVFVALASLAACTESTRLDVVIDGDESVRASARAVRLSVVGGRAPDQSDTSATRDVADIGWPAYAAIVPRDGDASREVRLDVVALDPAGVVIARVTASTGFVAGETRRVTLRLASRCADACVRDAGANEPGLDGGGAVPLERDAAMLDVARDGGVAPDVDGGAPAPDCPGEVCDGARDEDCDGRVDEGCDCVDGESRACEVAGACTPGAQRCNAGRWSECAGWAPALEEQCNGEDDDCDGRVDELSPRACGGAEGCAQACERGEWRACRDREGDRCRGERHEG